MSLERSEVLAVWSGGGCDGAGSIFAVSSAPARMLIADEHGHLIPYNQQHSVWDDDSGTTSRYYYVSSGEGPVDPATLDVLQRTSHKSGTSEDESFHDFVRYQMYNPPAGAQFIRYDGVEKVTLPQEHWHILGIRIPKKRRVRFVHRLSFCAVRAPLNG